MNMNTKWYYKTEIIHGYGISDRWAEMQEIGPFKTKEEAEEDKQHKYVKNWYNNRVIVHDKVYQR